eukprot:gene1506-2901_t
MLLYIFLVSLLWSDLQSFSWKLRSFSRYRSYQHQYNNENLITLFARVNRKGNRPVASKDNAHIVDAWSRWGHSGGNHTETHLQLRGKQPTTHPLENLNIKTIDDIPNISNIIIDKTNMNRYAEKVTSDDDVEVEDEDDIAGTLWKDTPDIATSKITSVTHSESASLSSLSSLSMIPSESDNIINYTAYDYLAADSLQGIEALPHFRFTKSESYLRKWWTTAKKWNLLVDELKVLDDMIESKRIFNNNNDDGDDDIDDDQDDVDIDIEDDLEQLMEEGDVHGCIDEVCDLLREVKYKPGDLVVFVGDLVAKGPSSVEVVRLAMDLGALSVRGNHDHEVVRQGVIYRNKANRFRGGPGPGSPIVPGSGPGSTDANTVTEHLRIALQLSLKEFKWMSELPYYIRSIDLGTLFVHAGFQKEIRLVEQDPWVMMTMRSLLPDGRISPRCFHKHPWAEKWSGPLTVVFGHDAARGLQSYSNAVGLDTGCVYGGRLTALILPDKDVISVPARKAYQDYGKSRSHKIYSLNNEGGGSVGQPINIIPTPVPAETEATAVAEAVAAVDIDIDIDTDILNNSLQDDENLDSNSDSNLVDNNDVLPEVSAKEEIYP